MLSTALIVEILVFLIGLVVVMATLGSAVRSVVLPRGVPAQLTQVVFRVVRLLFRLRAGRRPTYERSDKILALYAPSSLLILVLVWETLVLLGYIAMFWAIGVRPLSKAFAVSGSSLLTLGIESGSGTLPTLLTFTEAALGLLLLALLITFLPSLYAAFSRREALVAMLEVRAGSPPSAGEMITRFHRIHGLDDLDEVWSRWETWFVEVEETHTSFPALTFFRSPQPDHSWVTAAGTVLDTAALRASTLDLPPEPDADLCIRAGYIALRRIAAFFRIPFDPNPAPTDPISVLRHEYDEVYDALQRGGVPLKPDRDQAWRDFAGWRVNYDAVLLALATLTQAPMAPWSSDRSTTQRPHLFKGRRRLTRTG